jgi:hypothetical protein
VPLDIEQVLSRAAELLQTYEERVGTLTYERKGVLFSEMLFLQAAALSAGTPSQVLESGRARGQSTLLLALCFPDTPIASIEYDPNSPDVPVAEARLKAFPNLRLLFGDATRMLPPMLKGGDIALIDGPKGFRGLRLALSLLATGKPALIFIHDCPKGSAERTFLEAHMPQCLYSDHPDFVQRYARLDMRIEEALRPSLSPDVQKTGYGPTFACVPFVPGFPYRWTYIKAIWTGAIDRLSQSLAKLHSRRTGH